MKKIILALSLIAFLCVSCQKDDDTEIEDPKQDLHESNLAFINSDWMFETTGDSLKDQVIGLWLSNAVSYNDSICNDCDSLFTWVIESTGTMVKRNNHWGDHETQSGEWKIDANKKFIFYSYKEYAWGGTFDNYRIVTDTIRIEQLSKNDLWINQCINYPPTTKMDIRFNKLK